MTRRLTGWISRWPATRWGRVTRALAIVAVLVALPLGGCGGGGEPGGGGSAFDYVLDPQVPHYGASFALWSQRWWQWAYELPRTNHPLFDNVGTYAATGQVNPVWFIGGEIGSLFEPSDGRSVRTITIPSGIALFFPIVVVSWTNQECVEPDTTFTFTELRQLAAVAVETTTNIYCEVDGYRIIDTPDMLGAAHFRAQAEEFSYQLPADSIFVDICGDLVVSVVHAPVASDGIWMMLSPLPPGTHTIRWYGEFASGGVVDVDYTVIVAP